MRDMLEARKRGDLAFRDKDFKTAIDCYSQVCAVFFLRICFWITKRPLGGPLFSFPTSIASIWQMHRQEVINFRILKCQLF